MNSNTFEPNVLNVHNLRVLNVCPDYFYPVDFDIKNKQENINAWIYQNLQGRFFSGPWVKLVEGKSVIHHRVAFESANEAMYFMLVLPDVNKFSI
jgi:hypothetical protein